MDTFGLKIIASDRVFYEGRCRKLVIPAPDGEKGILPNHENMVIAVTIGMARMEIEEGNWMEVAFGRGFAEVVNNRVTLLVDTAEKAGRNRHPSCTGTERACRRANPPETEHSGVLPFPGISGKSHEPIESISGKTLEFIEKRNKEVCAKGTASLFFYNIFTEISLYPYKISSIIKSILKGIPFKFPIWQKVPFNIIPKSKCRKDG